jgi:hypothetical protein
MTLSGSDLALYGTIWLALALFVAGQAGLRTIARGDHGGGCSWWLWTGGGLLCVLHMIAALGVRHGWNHDAAVRATATQAESVYGVAWGGGVYVNYVFAAMWLGEAIWWRTNVRSFVRRSRAVTLLVRAFYLLILTNAAIVFAPPVRRLWGVAMIAALMWVWRPVVRPTARARESKGGQSGAAPVT